MPFLSLNKGTKRHGIQTFAKASALMPELRQVEIDYLDARDWYVNQVNVISQFQEALEQAKAKNDKANIKELGNKLQYEQAKIIDVRNRVKVAGERSWSEAFFLAASVMLPRDAMRQLEEEADRLLGRPRHELANSK